MTILYNRTYKLHMANTLVRDLRCTFNVSKSVDRMANKATISVFNLAPETRQLFIEAGEKRERFRLEAGYGGEDTLIFDGYSVLTSIKREGNDIKTHIIARDGFRATRKRINESVRKGSKVLDAIKRCARALDIPSNEALQQISTSPAALRVLENELVMSGSAVRQLDILCERIGAEWSVLDGKLAIVDINRTSGLIPRLSSASGLIGSPERRKDEKRLGRNQVSAKSLLIGSINPWNRVEIDSEFVSGIFKVEKVLHTGDSRGSEWSTAIEGYEIR